MQNILQKMNSKTVRMQRQSHDYAPAAPAGPQDVAAGTLYQFFLSYAQPAACALAQAAAAAPVGPVQSAACCGASGCNTADAAAVVAPQNASGAFRRASYWLVMT